MSEMTEVRRAYEKRAAAWKAYIDSVTLTDEGMRADVLTAFEAGYDAAIRDFEPPYPEIRRALDDIDADRKRLKARRFADEVYESARLAIDASQHPTFRLDKAGYVCRMVLLADAPEQYEADYQRTNRNP